MSMVVVHVATGTRNILVFLGRMAEAMGHALQFPGICGGLDERCPGPDFHEQ